MAPLTVDISNLIGTICWGVIIAFVPLLVARGLRWVLIFVSGTNDWRMPE